MYDLNWLHTTGVVAVFASSSTGIVAVGVGGIAVAVTDGSDVGVLTSSTSAVGVIVVAAVSVGDGRMVTCVGNSVANTLVGSVSMRETSPAQPTSDNSAHRLMNKDTKSKFFIFLSP